MRRMYKKGIEPGTLFVIMIVIIAVAGSLFIQKQNYDMLTKTIPQRLNAILFDGDTEFCALGSSDGDNRWDDDFNSYFLLRDIGEDITDIADFLNGIVYELEPHGYKFNNKVDFGFTDNNSYGKIGLKLSKEEIDLFNCTIAKQDEISEIISTRGGIIRLDDFEMRTNEGDLNEDTTFVLTKWVFNCSYDMIELNLSLINHHVNQNRVIFNYNGILPYKLVIHKHNQLDTDSSYVVAKLDNEEFTIDLGFSINPSRKFYYSAEGTEGIATGSFSLE